jgi:hypothetical protein
LQVAAIDDVEVDDADGPDAGGREIQCGGRTESSGTDQQHARCAKLRLAFETDVWEGEVPRVPEQLLVGQHGQFPEVPPAI